ncbi:MAG: hypothetical protein JM58_04620 [Peptococcaceae bacterium BICA1-8]|nr:MAG: hypothetical protein JM58_04620 [Peptococcaceae bacterium BICA1-8]
MEKALPELLIIGSGRMGSFLARKLSGIYQVYVYDRDREAAESLSQSSNALVVNKTELNKADLVILALASEVIPRALEEVEGYLAPNAVLVNIATTFAHIALNTNKNKVSAKIIGHAKEMDLGEKPVIIIEGDDDASREVVKEVFQNIGNVFEGSTDLVSKINTISSRFGIIAALEIKKALGEMDLDEEIITAAIRIVAAGTMKAFAVGDVGPFAQAIINEYQSKK